MAKILRLSRISAFIIILLSMAAVMICSQHAYADEDGYYIVPKNSIVLEPVNGYVSWEDMNGSSNADVPVYIKINADRNECLLINPDKSNYFLSPSFAERQDSWDNRIPLLMAYDSNYDANNWLMYEYDYYTSRATLFHLYKDDTYYLRVSGGNAGHISFSRYSLNGVDYPGPIKSYADYIKRNKTYRLSLISSFGDCDGNYSVNGKYQGGYKLKLKKGRTVRIKMATPFSSRKNATLYVYKGSKKIYKKSLSGVRGTSITFKKKLKKGNYYIRVVGENTECTLRYS